MALLEARGIVHRIGDRGVLDGLDLSLAAGEVLHVRGENGAGKTTLLRILAGLSQPQEGTIRLDGLPLDTAAPAARAAFSFVPARLAPSGWLTVEEFLSFRRALRPAAPGSDPETTLSAWDLQALRGRPLDALSEGERRRVVLAAAFSAGARILLLDEPTLSLDRAHAKTFRDQLRHASRAGGAIVASPLEGEDLVGGDRVLTLAGGRLA